MSQELRSRPGPALPPLAMNVRLFRQSILAESQNREVASHSPIKLASSATVLTRSKTIKHRLKLGIPLSARSPHLPGHHEHSIAAFLQLGNSICCDGSLKLAGSHFETERVALHLLRHLFALPVRRFARTLSKRPMLSSAVSAETDKPLSVASPRTMRACGNASLTR